MNQSAKDAVTVPAMRAVISRGRKPTLKLRTNVELQEEKQAQESRGRYSIIVPREDKSA